MRENFRIIFDKLFTVLTGLAVLSMVLALIVILGPMLYRGLGAVFFNGTVEFRKMQLAEFHHGDPEQVIEEDKQTQKVRQAVYSMISKFRNGVDAEKLTDHAKEIDRTYGK
jgi:phosphate transport system permease protein